MTETEAPANSYLKLGLVAAVAILLVVAWRTGVLEMFGEPARVKSTLLDLGGWGYLAFVVAYALLQPFGLPGTVFVMAAPLIWPWPIAFALSMIGTMAASVVGFSFARFVARDWVARRIPERFKRYDEALERRAFVTVATLRFVLWMPQPLHFFLGLSRVGFWTHFWGSLVGYAVPLFVVSFFGQKIFDVIASWPKEVWWISGGAVLALALGYYLFRWRRRRR